MMGPAFDTYQAQLRFYTLSAIISSLDILTKHPVTSENDNDLKPHLALLGVQVLFGSLPVIAKVVLTVIPAVALVGFRVGITALVLFSVQLYRKRVWLQYREDYLKLAAISLFAVTFNQLLFIGGLSLTKASNTSLLAVTIPIFTLIVSRLAGTELLRAGKVLGIALAAAGVIFLIDPRNASFSSATTLGDLMIIANSLSYGISSLHRRTRLPETEPSAR